MLTLEGLEDGVNHGPGRDSLERYIYLHGTNHEAEIGRPTSHGCVRLAQRRHARAVRARARRRSGRDRRGNARCLRLTPPQAIAPPARPFPNPSRAALAREEPNPPRPRALPLRRTRRQRHERPGPVPGHAAAAARAAATARSIAASAPSARAQLERLGIAIHPQDGSGVTADCVALVVSTAVEDQVPDVAAARARGIRIVHRSELLAHFVDALRTIAVTGTERQVDGGGDGVRAAARRRARAVGDHRRRSAWRSRPSGLWGNASYGGSDLLVVEADESDGSVVRYHPAIGVVLNLQRDHKRDEPRWRRCSRPSRGHTRDAFIAGEHENLDAIAAGAAARSASGRAPRCAPPTSRPCRRQQPVRDRRRFASRCRCPAVHNVENARRRDRERAGPWARRSSTSCARSPSSAALARRFQSLGLARGVEVVDDFAHNPAKIAAPRCARPTVARAHVSPSTSPTASGRRASCAATSSRRSRPRSRPTIGCGCSRCSTPAAAPSATFPPPTSLPRSPRAGIRAEFAPSRRWLIDRVAAEARDGDIVLVMGARDPSLSALARAGSSSASARNALQGRGPRVRRRATRRESDERALGPIGPARPDAPAPHPRRVRPGARAVRRVRARREPDDEQDEREDCVEDARQARRAATRLRGRAQSPTSNRDAQAARAELHRHLAARPGGARCSETSPAATRRRAATRHRARRAAREADPLPRQRRAPRHDGLRSHRIDGSPSVNKVGGRDITATLAWDGDDAAHRVEDAARDRRDDAGRALAPVRGARQPGDDAQAQVPDGEGSQRLVFVRQ